MIHLVSSEFSIRYVIVLPTCSNILDGANKSSPALIDNFNKKLVEAMHNKQ